MNRTAYSARTGVLASNRSASRWSPELAMASRARRASAAICGDASRALEFPTTFARASRSPLERISAMSSSSTSSRRATARAPMGSRTASFKSSRETLRPRVSIRTPASSRCWMSTCRIAEGMSALGASFRAMASLAHSSTDCRNLEYVVTKGSRLVAVSGLASTRQSVAIRSQTNRSSGRWLRASASRNGNRLVGRSLGKRKLQLKNRGV